MKKTKLEKGITLIALIITIIILLILAVVTIGSIKNSNIITYAQNAAGDYQIKADEENKILDGYVSLIEESISKDKSKEKVSIIGTYGNMDYQYYEFKADGTGKYYYHNGSDELFNYSMQDNENGTITIIETGEKETFTFKYIKDSDNKLINKIVTVTSNDGDVVISYTTEGNTGFSEISSDIIYEHVKLQTIKNESWTISFKDGKCIAKEEESEIIQDWGYYYKDESYIYLQSEFEAETHNVFEIFFKINGNELEYIG